MILFVDDKSNIREEFLEFIHCQVGKSGKAISDVILHQLVQLGIVEVRVTIERETWLVKIKVLLSTFNRCGKALGCHYQAHLLNLCVVSACKINSVLVMMNKLRCVQEFF